MNKVRQNILSIRYYTRKVRGIMKTEMKKALGDGWDGITEGDISANWQSINNTTVAEVRIG